MLILYFLYGKSWNIGHLRIQILKKKMMKKTSFIMAHYFTMRDLKKLCKTIFQEEESFLQTKASKNYGKSIII